MEQRCECIIISYDYLAADITLYDCARQYKYLMSVTSSTLGVEEHWSLDYAKCNVFLYSILKDGVTVCTFFNYL